MNQPILAGYDNGRISIRELESARPDSGDDMARDVRAGLLHRPKSLPPKYFYDERGSTLFDRICETPEYYPTRTEDALLKTHAHRIIETVRPDAIVELGSGASRKTTRLFDACDEQACYSLYHPVDVCREMLAEAGQRLLREHDWLEIEAWVGDYCAGLSGLPTDYGSRLFLFLGGTIGNFSDDEALEFLRGVRSQMDAGDWLLLGADRVKDSTVLNAAYNDAAGYTAAFNRNVLRVINRELDADFDPADFRHHAFFNESRSRIEMHLAARHSHSVEIQRLGLQVPFARDETILTEISRKYTPDELETLLLGAGLVTEAHFAPDNGYYSLVLVRPRPRPA